jgi:hypothetical protein
MKLFSQALVAIDGSKFKAYTARDRNFTNGKIDKRQQQIEESIQRYLSTLEAFSCCRSTSPNPKVQLHAARSTGSPRVASRRLALRFQIARGRTIDWLRQ